MPQEQLLKGRRSSALLVLAALAPLALFATILSILAIDWQRRTTESEAQSQAHLLRLSIDRYIDSNFAALSLLASSPRLDPTSDDLAAFHEIASRAVKEVGAWDQVILLDLSGQQIVNTIVPYGTALPEVVERESFEEILRSQRPVVSGLSEKGNFVARERRIGFRVPVFRDGRLRYVLTGVFRPERFSSLIDLPDIKTGWRPFLADSKGRLVVAPRSPAATPGRELQKSGLEARKANSGTYTSQTADGEPTVTVFSKSTSTGWSAHIAIPQSIFMGPMRRFQIILGSAAVLTLTCTGLFIWLLKRESEARAQEITASEHARRLEALGRVAGGVAHDFNNLLTAIMSSLQSLRRGQRTGERAERLFETAIMATERGSSLTQRLLAFSRKQELKPEPVAVAQVFAAVERLFSHATQDVTFVADIGPNVAGVIVDRAQLEAALLNLCNNARDAMPDGGRLTLTARRAHAAQSENGESAADHTFISIADTGVGMDAMTAAKALEPFFSTKGSRGTGLGLSTAKAFAVQSGGDLTISSELGLGTTVTLVLPSCDLADQTSTLPPKTPSMREISVMVVDDDPLVLLGTRSMLEELGYVVTPARSGSEALQKLSTVQASLVLTDYRMSGMTGLELAQELSAIRPEIPVIIYSGYADLIASQVSFPVVSKPASAETLARAISDRIERPLA